MLAFCGQHFPGIGGDSEPDENVVALVRGLSRVARFRRETAERHAPFLPAVEKAFATPEGPATLAGKLEEIAEIAARVDGAFGALHASRMLAPQSLLALRNKVIHGKPVSDDFAKLREDLALLEPLLRYEHDKGAFPPAAVDLLRACYLEGRDIEEAWCLLISGACHANAWARVKASKELSLLDADRIEADFERIWTLSAQKRQLVAQHIRHLWTDRQKEQMLASTGTRLNSAGTSLRMRLGLRGKNATRIRELILRGQNAEEPDPLFTLRPVWMTSPQTACQVFPLDALFDVVIFDEASQCRLEEGLPALTRGRSVVISGDTKQLPPTSFFQSAVASSSESLETDESDEGLFAAQQSEIEDLLSAALNIEVEQSYLDVHYRSVAPALIQFSNSEFYGSRLQAIPGHPNSRPKQSPLRLHNVDGVLEDRCNEIEARYVVDLVRSLLGRDDPPSIGIVTFNLVQKDLIEELLDETANDDAEFRSLLTAARARQGESSYEGLFVKNLENVQGDERDHIILSTTFGPTREGRFYRRFGPLAQPGGERRLNVIVTRARHQIDIVTSIPREVYRAAAGTEIPEGQRPNGALSLMRYLAMAESIDGEYETAISDAPGDSLPAEAGEESAPVIERWPTTVPSSLTEGLAEAIRRTHTLGSTLYYANDGFAVDLALDRPGQPREVSIGVLADPTRFPGAEDKLEWDLFRCEIFAALGWDLKRVWSPVVLRDFTGTLQRLHGAAETHRAPLESEETGSGA